MGEAITVLVVDGHQTFAELLGVAKTGDALQFISAQIREHRVHFQDDRKFGLFAHCTTFQNKPGSAPSGR